jgi:hypothetical protein
MEGRNLQSRLCEQTIHFSLVKVKVDLPLPEKHPRKKMTLFSNMAKQYLRSDESTSMIRILTTLLPLPFDAEWVAAAVSSTNLTPSTKWI